MARTLKSDKLLFLATLLLVGTSIVMVYSASSFTAMTSSKFNDPNHFLYKQLAWAILGTIVLSVAMRVDYRFYRQPALIWSALVVCFVLLVGVLFTRHINGTSRWFSLGPVSFQPSELTKLTLTIFTAALLERRMHRVNEVSYALMPIGIATGILVLLILVEPDFGTSVAILGIIVAIIFAAGLKYRYLFSGLIVLIPALVGVAIIEPYRIRRLLSFLDPWAHQLGDGYQVVQGWIAIGSGGLFGRGLMAGVAKQSFLPEAHTDFIAAVIGEELGLIGITLLIITFCIVAWRGLRAAVLAPDRFGALLAIGLTTMVAVQAFFNLSVVTGLLPNKGMPLPLVSNGGSSLLINLVGMGILLNISQQASTVAATKVGVDPEV
jgi:cell division protein FtsW